MVLTYCEFGNNGPYYEQTRPNPAEACENRCGVAGRRGVKWGFWRAVTNEGCVRSSSELSDLFDALSIKLTNRRFSACGTC